MNIEVPVVIPLVIFFSALGDLCSKVPTGELSLANRHRLLAYELLALPAILEYNLVLTTHRDKGLTYRRQDRADLRPSSSQDGMHTMIVRAPMVDAVRIALQYDLTRLLQNKEIRLKCLNEILAKHNKQPELCCWFDRASRDACNAKGHRRLSNYYAFCQEHWNRLMRRTGKPDDAPEPYGAAACSTDTADDFLDAII
jgi:hypothetical protein